MSPPGRPKGEHRSAQRGGTPASAPSVTFAPFDRVHAQIAGILAAWGFAGEWVDAAADVLATADLFGIDSHGIAMLPVYERFLAEGRLDRRARITISRETPVSALVDGNSGLGHLPARTAMRLAIARAKAIGIGVVAVRGSNHFGAAGIYAKEAADDALIGIVASNVHTAAVVPTRAMLPMFGTNPLAVAAPSASGRPFLFDMATSTVALGKLMVASYRGERIPEGWALGPDGRPTTDPDIGYAARMATPLGATAELSSHKGYGLGMVVEILAGTLSGADYAPLRAASASDARRGNVGHFMLALDPKLFREAGEFERDLDAMVRALRATPPVEPGEPVLVAGDPEYRRHDERRVTGIPIARSLTLALEGVARRAGARWELA